MPSLSYPRSADGARRTAPAVPGAIVAAAAREGLRRGEVLARERVGGAGAGRVRRIAGQGPSSRDQRGLGALYPIANLLPDQPPVGRRPLGQARQLDQEAEPLDPDVLGLEGRVIVGALRAPAEPSDDFAARAARTAQAPRQGCAADPLETGLGGARRLQRPLGVLEGVGLRGGGRCGHPDRGERQQPRPRDPPHAPFSRSARKPGTSAIPPRRA